MKAREIAAYGVGLGGILVGLLFWIGPGRRDGVPAPARPGAPLAKAQKAPPRPGGSGEGDAARREAEEWRRRAEAAQKEADRSKALLSAMDAPSGGKRVPSILRLLQSSAEEAQNPETLAAMRSEIAKQYADLFGSWGLSGAERDAVVDILARRRAGEMRLAPGIFDCERLESEFLAAQERLFAASETELKSHLPPFRIAEIESFDRSRAEAGLEAERARQVGPLKLDAARSEEALRILREEDARSREGGEGGMGDFMLLSDDGSRMTGSQLRRMRLIVQNPAAFLAPFREREARAMERMKGILSAEELAAYRKSREEEMRKMRSVVEVWSGQSVGE